MKKVHYAWKILIAMCFIKSASMCFVTTLTGIFIAPVCEELGVGRAVFTAPQLLTSAAAIITALFLNRIYKNFDFRKTMSLSGIIYAACPFVLAAAHNIYVWYVMAVLQGVAAGILCNSVVPLILSNWFSDKYATALGINGAVGSALSMFSNPLGAVVIKNFGWRAMYIVCGTGIALMVLPFTVFVLRLTPAEMGLEPYGGRIGEKTVQSSETECFDRAGELLVIAAIFLTTFIMNLGAGAIPMLANHAAIAGYDPTFGSMLVSMGLGGAMVAKLLLGPLISRFGCVKTQLLVSAVAGVGYVLFWTTGGYALYALAFACGWFMTTTSVVIPAFLREVYGTRLFNRWISVTAAFSTLTYSAAQSIFAGVADRNGDYKMMFVICSVGCLVSWLLMVGITIFKKRQQAKMLTA